MESETCVWCLRTWLNGTLADPGRGFKMGRGSPRVPTVKTPLKCKTSGMARAGFPLSHLRSPSRLHARHASFSSGELDGDKRFSGAGSTHRAGSCAVSNLGREEKKKQEVES